MDADQKARDDRVANDQSVVRRVGSVGIQREFDDRHDGESAEQGRRFIDTFQLRFSIEKIVQPLIFTVSKS